MTAPCPCGGETYVDSFDWPKRKRVFFLRCEQCRGMSKAVSTSEEAEQLKIEPEEAAEAADANRKT